MFVGIARLTLSIPGAASLKDKRQVLRKLLDRTRARFNLAIAEVAENDLWQKAVVGLAVVGNERRFVEESLGAVLHFIEESYLAPVLDRQTELVPMGGDLFGGSSIGQGALRIDAGTRSMAEAEGLVEPGNEDYEGWDEEEP